MLDAILAQSRNTALIMGLVALIGLLLQKKSAVAVSYTHLDDDVQAVYHNWDE